MLGKFPVWFCRRTQSPTLSGESSLVCSVQRSWARLCLWRRVVSLCDRLSCHVGWGWYFPGTRGMRSLVGRPKRHVAGDCLVAELRYWSMARCTASTSTSPSGPTLPAMILLTVLTAISARQLPWGKATEVRRWCHRAVVWSREL